MESNPRNGKHQALNLQGPSRPSPLRGMDRSMLNHGRNKEAQGAVWISCALAISAAFLLTALAFQSSNRTQELLGIGQELSAQPWDFIHPGISGCVGCTSGEIHLIYFIHYQRREPTF
jgi:hypothetical protein